MSDIGNFVQTLHQVLSDTTLQFFVSTALSGTSIVLAQKSSAQTRGNNILKKNL